MINRIYQILSFPINAAFLALTGLVLYEIFSHSSRLQILETSIAASMLLAIFSSVYFVVQSWYVFRRKKTYKSLDDVLDDTDVFEEVHFKLMWPTGIVNILSGLALCTLAALILAVWGSFDLRDNDDLIRCSIMVLSFLYGVMQIYYNASTIRRIRLHSTDT